MTARRAARTIRLGHHGMIVIVRALAAPLTRVGARSRAARVGVENGYAKARSAAASVAPWTLLEHPERTHASELALRSP